jgi:hypothetical protein
MTINGSDMAAEDQSMLESSGHAMMERWLTVEEDGHWLVRDSRR